jgi:hypothetical protein
MPVDYGNKEAQRLSEEIYRNGVTQERVNALYATLGLANPPRVPSSLEGSRAGAGRAQSLITGADGRTRPRTSEEAGFFNTLARQAVDPYREYGVGNYLGLAGLVAGAAGALGPAGAGGGSSGGTAAGSNLGIFANGGTAGLAGVGGGSAGALAASGGIAGGAGIGGTTAGALGGLSGLANTVSGAGGGNMGWNWGDILEYGVPIIGGLLERDGAKDAARAEQAGSLAAIGESRRQYDQSRTDMMPWLDAGRNALADLQNPAAFTASPDYEFRRSEGNRDIGNSFAATGSGASGNALRALTQFNSNLASGEFGDWWNRRAGLAGVGQTSAQNLGALGANSAANVGGFMQNAANARASGVAGGTNALTNTLQNLYGVWNRNRAVS